MSATPLSSIDDLRVDVERLWRRIVELGEIGAIEGPNG